MTIVPFSRQQVEAWGPWAGGPGANGRFTVHAESRGELNYALGYYRDQHDIIQIAEGP